MSNNTEPETLICQFCQSSTPTEFNFCIECDQQIKCIECGSKTFNGKDYCLKCSKPLAVKKSNSQAPNHYVRTVEKVGKNYKEHIEFSLSDKAVSEIAPFVISQTMPEHQGTPQTKKLVPNRGAEDATYEEISDKVSQSSIEQENAEVEMQNSRVGQNQTIATNPTTSYSKYFQRDGDILIPYDNDFKGKSWSEQQRNFIILYTKAYYEIMGQPVPDKEHYKIAGNKISIIDKGNISAYINKATTTFMSSLSNGYVLNKKGESEADNITKLMSNESEKPGYQYWVRTASGPVAKPRLSNEDKARIDIWTSDDVNLGELDIRNITTAKNYSLPSLWIITIHLKKAGAVKWNEAYYYLTKKFATTAVKAENFSKAMHNKDNDKLFSKSVEGDFYLSPEAQETVENWISGKVKIKKEDISV